MRTVPQEPQLLDTEHIISIYIKVNQLQNNNTLHELELLSEVSTVFNHVDTFGTRQY